jgi:predicted Zn-dependent protease
MNLSRLAAPALALLLGTLSHDAHAQCGMGEVDWYAAEAVSVSSADDLLRQGENAEAAGVLMRMWPRMHEAVPVRGSVPIIAEGVRLMAIAAVRADGDVGSSHGWSSRTAADRAANVAWGIARLRMLSASDPLNTLAKTSLGEALARAPETRDEGGRILEELDAANQLFLPEGYAALALVRADAGDTTGALAASEQCERRASRVHCVALGGRVPPAETASLD